MGLRREKVAVFAGGDSILNYGTLVRRTSPTAEVLETHTRAGTATFTDRLGATRTAEANVPRVHWLDLDSDGVFEQPVLRLDEGDGDVFYVDFERPPQAMTFLFRFRAPTLAGATTMMRIGSAADINPEVELGYSGSQWRLRHNNDIATVNSVLTQAITATDTVDLWGQLQADGRVQVGVALNDGAFAFGPVSGTNALPAAWAGTRLYLNGTGTGRGDADIMAAVLALGAFTPADMRSAA